MLLCELYNAANFNANNVWIKMILNSLINFRRLSIIFISLCLSTLLGACNTLQPAAGISPDTTVANEPTEETAILSVHSQVPNDPADTYIKITIIQDTREFIDFDSQLAMVAEISMTTVAFEPRFAGIAESPEPDLPSKCLDQAHPSNYSSKKQLPHWKNNPMPGIDFNKA